MPTDLIQPISTGSSAMLWSAWITALASLLLAFLTFIYVRLTKRIIDSQTDPCVTVSVVHDDERRTVLQLIIKNIGTGIAQDVEFEASRPIPSKAWGISSEDAEDPQHMTSGPLIDGIPALGPGEERKIDWGQYGGLSKAVGLEPIIIFCKFKKHGKLMPRVECKLDVNSFAGTVANQKPIVGIANHLEKISRNLDHIVSGFSKLHVKITDLNMNNNLGKGTQ